MLVQFLLVLHVAVLGYWLGSEFVINSTFRYVCSSAEMPFNERNRLLEHVMTADQHVRYALILQLTLGFMLTALLGYIPGNNTQATTSLILGLLWLALIETTHRSRHNSLGQKIAKVDRLLRYSVITGLIVTSLLVLIKPLPFLQSIAISESLPKWLAIKLICFAAIMGCGVGIRLIIIRLYKIWRVIEADGTTDQRELHVKKCYVQASSILLLLWAFIISIVALSIWKPF